MAKPYPGKIRIIGGQYKGRSIPVADMEALRPTPSRIRETLSNWLSADLQDMKVVDFFAGTGILGFESLSRGASHCTMVDIEPQTVKQLNQLANEMKILPSQIDIKQQDAFEFIKLVAAEGKKFDLFFLDPPFHTPLLKTGIQILTEYPIFNEEAYIYIECPASDPTPSIEGFALKKSKQAASVSYHLFQKEGHE